MQREIGVVGVREEIGECPDLQAGRSDVGEIARARLRERLVECLGCLVEGLDDVDACFGQREVECGEECR